MFVGADHPVTIALTSRGRGWGYGSSLCWRRGDERVDEPLAGEKAMYGRRAVRWTARGLADEDELRDRVQLECFIVDLSMAAEYTVPSSEETIRTSSKAKSRCSRHRRSHRHSVATELAPSGWDLGRVEADPVPA
jgi:hypothetical protein